MHAVRLRHIGQRLDIFGKAGAAKADARLQKMRTDALVEAHAARDFFYIGAQSFADDADLVDEADARRQEGVGGVFDHLGRANIGDDDWGVERRV